MTIKEEKVIDNDASLFKWQSELKYLPVEMRTFDKFSHVFHFLHECMGESDGKSFHKELNYRQGTIYIVDMFLWTMAKYGYTLQRSRIRGCDFADLYESMEALRQERRSENYNTVRNKIVNYQGKPKLNACRKGENPAYLPDILKDFHNQKSLFKFLHNVIDREGDKDHILEQISFIDAQIYTIDYFLFIMFKYGYSLQKSRAKFKFYNIQEEIKKMEDKQTESFVNMLKGGSI